MPLHPRLVGQRIVVRLLVPGETGPSGGPAMTDVLGILQAWNDDEIQVRREDGTTVSIPLEDIVTGKPVPPRASARHRVSAAEAERRALASWPALEEQPLGEWLLRAAQGFSSRANSVLAVGDPGAPQEQALARVVDFYTARDLPAWAQVVVDSPEASALAAAGWVPARPGEADTQFQIASVAQALRSARRLQPADPAPVTFSARAGSQWLSDDARAVRYGAAAVGVLEGPDVVAFAQIGTEAIAKARVAFDDDWIGISDVAVAPEHRQRGLARVVMAAVLDWGAERGARTAYLQVRGDNAAALALYEGLGFTTHHSYRYLRAP